MSDEIPFKFIRYQNNGYSVFDIVEDNYLSSHECAKRLNNCMRAISKKDDEIERLISELNKYYKKFNCHQCHYHNYDGLGIDFEYEVCDKGNDEALMDNHSCSEWEEL